MLPICSLWILRGLLHLLEVGILDVLTLVATLCVVGTGLRTCLLATCLSVHLGTCCLEGGVELVHGCIYSGEVL